MLAGPPYSKHSDSRTGLAWSWLELLCRVQAVYHTKVALKQIDLLLESFIYPLKYVLSYLRTGAIVLDSPQDTV